MMTTKIWIEPLRHSDGRQQYDANGQLYQTRLGGPDGQVLVLRTATPSTSSCRALLVLGISGPFETWREGGTYAYLQGDIEKVAGLAVEENSTTAPRFKKWRPHAVAQDGVPRDSGAVPAREDGGAGRQVAGDAFMTLGDPEFGQAQSRGASA
jgi:hypothetical protein